MNDKILAVLIDIFGEDDFDILKEACQYSLDEREAIDFVLSAKINFESNDSPSQMDDILLELVEMFPSIPFEKIFDARSRFKSKEEMVDFLIPLKKKKVRLCSNMPFKPKSTQIFEWFNLSAEPDEELENLCLDFERIIRERNYFYCRASKVYSFGSSTGKGAALYFSQEGMNRTFELEALRNKVDYLRFREK